MIKAYIKKKTAIAIAFALTACSMVGCGKSADEQTTAVQTEASTEASTEAETTQAEAVSEIGLADGEYLAEFETDSSMFRMNDAYDGKAKLTVKDGKATIHIVMPSTKILKLYLGLAEDAKKEGAELIDHTVETVNYSDGTTDEANAFDVPVPVIGKEFDLALIGKKDKWYDHKVVVKNPVPASEAEDAPAGGDAATQSDAGDFTQTINVTLEGGSGKATVESPAKFKGAEGNYTVRLVWSSPHYDYMIVNGEKYLPVNTEGNSVFEIPVASFAEPITVIADTTAMSKPHEVEYVLTFDEDSIAKLESSLALSYATQFSVDFLPGGYKHIHVEDGNDYILVPEGKPEDKCGFEQAKILHAGSGNIYLAASSAMDLFRQLNALDNVKATSTKAVDYTLEEERDRMDRGDISYVGKYSSPDYEMLVSSGCELAIESTMIYHKPKVKEQLERLGIPVFVERSSYEQHPLGRLEWIRLYGILLGKEAEADAFFAEKCAQFDKLQDASNNVDKPSVAVFYVSSNGYVNVRKPGDYVSKMIELAGGSYALSDLKLEEDNALSTVNVNWEDFYMYAKDADVLIYNSTIYGELETVQDLLKQNELFADFKAVREGNVWCTGMNMFQESSKFVEMIEDFAAVLREGKNAKTTYLYYLE